MLLTSGCSFVYGDELQGFDTNPPSHWHHTFTHRLAEHLGVSYNNHGACGAGNQKIFRDLMRWFAGETLSWTYKPDGTICTPENTTHMVILWTAWPRDEIPCNIRTRAIASQYPNIIDYDNMTQYSPKRIHTIKYLTEDVKRTINNYYMYHEDNRKFMIQQLPYLIALEKMCEANNIKLIQGSLHNQNWRTLGWSMAHSEGFKSLNKILSNMLGSLKQTSRVGLGYYQEFNKFCGDPEYPERQFKPYDHPNEVAHYDYGDYLYKIFQEDF